jgi:hypothetical protein
MPFKTIPWSVKEVPIPPTGVYEVDPRPPSGVMASYLGHRYSPAEEIARDRPGATFEVYENDETYAEQAKLVRAFGGHPGNCQADQGRILVSPGQRRWQDPFSREAGDEKGLVVDPVSPQMKGWTSPRALSRRESP